MKKVSTAAAQPSRIFSQQKLTGGLDLGDRNSWFCVVDDTGKIQLEQQVRTSTKALQQVFGAMPRSRIALEIGTHSPWISRWLGPLGHEVIVANGVWPRQLGCPRRAGFARLGASVHCPVSPHPTRYYGNGDLHFITFSCYRRLPLLARGVATCSCAPSKPCAGSIGSS